MDSGTGWRLGAVAPSYGHFQALAYGNSVIDLRPTGSEASAPDLLASAIALCGSDPNLVAIDMPLSRKPILCRRASDDAVSRAYGSRLCSTHTPSTARPGRISDDLTKGFDDAGHPLLTSASAKPPSRQGSLRSIPIPRWSRLPAYRCALNMKLGKGGPTGRVIRQRRDTAFS